MFVVKRGDLSPSWKVNLTQTVNGVTTAADLTGLANPTFIMWPAAGSIDNPAVTGTATITNALQGEVTFDWTGTDTDTSGLYYAELRFIVAGEQETFPSIGAFAIAIDGPGLGLVSLAQLKQTLGVTTDDKDEQYLNAILAASQAIANYTDRDFDTAPVTEERFYEYDGSGMVEIDDASAITQVKLESSVLSSQRWVAQPLRGPVVYWIDGLPPGFADSGVMGFERNEDVFVQQFGSRRPLRVYVTGTWGWNAVPADVRQAAIWIAAAMVENPELGSSISSQSVAEVARAYVTGGTDTKESIPVRASRILDQYRRQNI